MIFDMDMIDYIKELSKEIRKSSIKILNQRELAEQIITNNPTWLPNLIYDPAKYYEEGQRLFHTSPKVSEWFTILECVDDKVLVTMDSGKKMTLAVGSSQNYNFPTNLMDYILVLLTQCERREILNQIIPISTSNELEVKRVSDIKAFIQERQIKNLIHFTHKQNLLSIMSKGLLNRLNVEKISGCRINDEKRLDNCCEAICLSISFPNYRMFHKYKKDSPSDWVVLAIKPDILWEFDCAFCYDNAANGKVTAIPLDERKKVEALRGLFLDIDGIKRSDLHIPKYFPTNPQAELLVFNEIPVEYIQKIYFFNSVSKINWLEENSIGDSKLFEVEANFFSPRCDYEHWKKNVVEDDYLEYIFGIEN